jgi:hypothetical protein
LRVLRTRFYLIRPQVNSGVRRQQEFYDRRELPMARSDTMLARVKDWLGGKVACEACGATGPDDLMLLTMPSGIMICHPCLMNALRAAVREDAAGSEEIRCVGCSERRMPSELQSIGRISLCDQCLARTRETFTLNGYLEPAT